MSDPRDDQHYEAPAIDEREAIETPLVAVASGASESAAFHPSDESATDYEPPAIEDRTKVDTPLIGAGSPCLPTVSAGFHPAHDDDEYEPPVIAERQSIDDPLIGFGSGEPTSAAFHPADDEYRPPAIEEREPIDTPLVATAGGSGVTCVATH